MLPEGTISVIRPYRPPLTDKQFHVASHRGIDKASLSVREAVLISNIFIYLGRLTDIYSMTYFFQSGRRVALVTVTLHNGL